MFVHQGLNGFGDVLSTSDLNKLIETGDAIERIAHGITPATEEQRAAAIALVQKFGGEDSSMSGLSGFGGPLDFLKRLPRAIADRSKSIIRETGQAIKSGNVIKVLSIANPVGVAIRLTTSNQKTIDKLSLSTPLTVGAIQDKDLRKKALIGYGAAAVIATGIAAAAGAEGAATAGAAEGTAAGGGALATAAQTVGVASSAVGVAKATGLLPGQKEGAAPADAGQGEEIEKSSLASMVTPQNILLFMGLSALTVAGFMMFNQGSVKTRK